MSKSTWINGKRAVLTEDTAVITQETAYDVAIAVRRIWATDEEEFVKIEGNWIPLRWYVTSPSHAIKTYHKVVEIL